MTPAFRTAAFWALALATLGTAGLLTGSFVLMALSLDPGEIVLAGAEPWTNAAEAVAAFAALAVTTALSLRLWHSDRWRGVSLLMTLAGLGIVAWACRSFYTDYF